MAYEKTNWVSDETVVSAVALNKIESELLYLDKNVDALHREDAIIHGRIDKEIEDRIKDIKDANLRMDGIDQEIVKLKAEDVKINTRIDTEIYDRKAADDAINVALKKEASDRITGDTLLQNKLAEEKDARTSQDNILSNRISQEVTARSAADDNLNEKIDTEAGNRIKEVDRLNGLILKEVSDRNNQDSALDKKIQQEVSSRVSAVKDLVLHDEKTDAEISKINKSLQNTLYVNIDYPTLNTSKKSIIGAINELQQYSASQKDMVELSDKVAEMAKAISKLEIAVMEISNFIQVNPLKK